MIDFADSNPTAISPSTKIIARDPPPKWAAMSAVQAIMAAQATPEGTAAFGQWLVASAQTAANAANEGGFVGFGAAQVSKGESEMLDQVRAAVSQA